MLLPVSLLLYFFFFFSSRRRHTRYWRDWSSDVCSSDLSGGVLITVLGQLTHLVQGLQCRRFRGRLRAVPNPDRLSGLDVSFLHLETGEIGRASCRERV